MQLTILAGKQLVLNQCYLPVVFGLLIVLLFALRVRLCSRNQLQIEAANLHPVARLEDGLLARHPIDNDAIAAPGILNTDSGVVATQLSMVAGNRFMHQTDRVCRITTQLGNAILERPALSAAIPLNHNHCPLATDRLHSGLIRSISRFTEFVEKPAQHIAGS